MLSVHQCATLACLLDVIAPKPGNVHRGADFEDMTFEDFALSAVAIGPVMEQAPGQSLGSTVLEAVRATRAVTSANTNLGIILLMAPIAKAGRPVSRENVAGVLNGLDEADGKDVYEAIRLARPGGLGDVEQRDVRKEEACDDLVGAMSLAADRDSIAKQYATGFAFLFEMVVPTLREKCQQYGRVSGMIYTALEVMATEPDSLIARKCGIEVARQASKLSKEVLLSGYPNSEESLKLLADMDFWLRADANRRNPGTTADLVTAAMFVELLVSGCQSQNK